MKLSLRSLSALLAGGVLVVGATGCKVEGSAETPVRYEDSSPRNVEEPWVSGQNIRIDGMYGDIDVVEGSSADTLSVDVLRFHYWQQDEEAEARQMMDDHIQYGIDNAADELVVYTERTSGGSNGLGADITVRLPTGFDGSLMVRNRSDGPINPGDIDVQYTAGAFAVNVDTDDLGDCRVRGTTSVTQTVANCDGEIDIRGIADAVDINATGLETGEAVDVRIAAISADFTAGGTINADDGDVSLTLPTPANNDFMVQARTLQGTVTFAESADCSEVAWAQEDVHQSGTHVCGAAEPLYAIEACEDGVGDCNVTIAYQ